MPTISKAPATTAATIGVFLLPATGTSPAATRNRVDGRNISMPWADLYHSTRLLPSRNIPRPDSHGLGQVLARFAAPRATPTAPVSISENRGEFGQLREHIVHSAAAGGRAAALADVAGARRTHLGAAGEAERRIGGLADDHLEQLGRGSGLASR